MSELPFELNEIEKLELERWIKTIKMVGPYADRYLVHGTMKTKLSAKNAKYVPTPVRDLFLESGKTVTNDGPVVVSMGHLAPPSLDKILEGSKLEFVIYGSNNPRKVNNVEYKAFDENEFIKSLQRSPFVIVSANSSAIDALAFNKPLLYCPTPGQFEQKFCGKMFEHLGVAKLVDELSSLEINSFSNNLDSYREKISELNIFDNELLFNEIERAISECQ